MMGYGSGKGPYRNSGTAAAASPPTQKKAGMLGSLGKLGKAKSSKSSSSSANRQPSTAQVQQVLICEPVEGTVYQSMDATLGQPVEGVACQPVVVQGP